MNENTRSGAVDASAQFTEEMMANLERAMDHPDMTLELAALLSTSQVELEYRIESGVEVRADRSSAICADPSACSTFNTDHSSRSSYLVPAFATFSKSISDCFTR